MDNDIREIISLVYLNSYPGAYQYSELKLLLGFNTSQLKEFIDYLYQYGVIKSDETLILSEKGKHILKENALENVHINDLLQEKNCFEIEDEKLDFEDIYIPKNFKL